MRTLLVYFIRQAGGNTPRSGLKNAEERRKELDKMRDEARARRAEEAVRWLEYSLPCVVSDK